VSSPVVRNLSRTLGQLLVLGLIARPLAAQDPPRRDSTAQRIEPREVLGARTATVVGGASVQTVRLDSARTAIAPSLADVLRTIPLVVARTNSRGEVELSVRGSESRQMGIMLNGLPLSPGWDGRADPSLIPLTGISELSFVRATSSVLGGPNTLGGVIDLRVDHDARRRL
jgi:outer membrane cobalamin receptor